MAEVTEFLSAFGGDQPQTAAKLLPLVYDELKRLAAARLAHERKGHTLTATSLVHEAYVRLVKNDTSRRWANPNHFFAVAAEAIRRILVDNARRKGAVKRGGGLERQNLDDLHLTWDGRENLLLELSDAIETLEKKHPRKAALVKLRFFAGLIVAEAAEVLGISKATAQNDWAYARAWLQVELQPDDGI